MDTKNIQTFSPEMAEKIEVSNVILDRKMRLEKMRDYHRAQAERLFISGNTRSEHIGHWLLCRGLLGELEEKTKNDNSFKI